jgi:hypothetical protein
MFALGFFGVGIWTYVLSAIEEWRSLGLLLRLLMVIAGLSSILALFEAFWKRTVFTEAAIEHRSSFGSSIRRPYREVDGLEWLEDRALRIRFSDGRSIRISLWEADLRKLKAFLLPKVPHLAVPASDSEPSEESG